MINCTDFSGHFVAAVYGSILWSVFEFHKSEGGIVVNGWVEWRCGVISTHIERLVSHSY